MRLEPIGDYVLTRPLPQAVTSALWTPGREEYAAQATVVRGEGFTAGDLVLVSMRQAIQVGDDLLLPVGGILARLG